MAISVLALLVGIVGILFASQATMGVAIVGFACLLAIVGRIQQASVQHKELLGQIKDSRTSEEFR